MDSRNDSLRDLLAFYAESGVDDALVDDAPNRFQASPRVSPITGEMAAKRPDAADAAVRNLDRPHPDPVRRSTLPSSGREVPATPPGGFAAPSARGTQAAVPDEGQVALARQRAATAATLDELRRHMAEFEGCNLKFTAKNLVFADGNPDAALMLVGEAPGREEDLEGLPFVGRSGQLLDRILAAIGLDRASAYIANVIPWRPPGNRTPTPQETEICRPFIERQIELAGPKVLVALGGPSAKLLLGTTDGILRLRGTWKVHSTASGVSIPVMPTLHPAYLLRNPAHKKLAWRDFLEVKARLKALG